MTTQNCLHGDLNPTNVIVSKTDVYLIDFEFSDEIDSAQISIEKELTNLISLLVIILSSDLKRVFNLMSLYEYTNNVRLPFALKRGVNYDDIKRVIM